MSKLIKGKYKATIGLEVHAQLLTKSKIFCADSTQYGATANTQVGVISLGHPGVLPKLNKSALEAAVKMGLACHSEISRTIQFDRKNYFYPDLPKGYQITQEATPICLGGRIAVTVGGVTHEIELNRIHLEEDAGKSIHVEGEMNTLLDYNRAGIPLIEIVTEPVIQNSRQAYSFLTEIRKLVRYLEICDGNMEEGSLRCDANVSVTLNDAKEFGKKVEIKNMNSIRNVQRAIDFEIERQVALLELGEEIISHTRTFDAGTGETYEMRTKEELNDYRYFTDPDLSPIVISDVWLQSLKETMPVLPSAMKKRFEEEFGLPTYDAELLSESKELAHFYEEVCAHTSHFKIASNLIMGPLKSYLNDLPAMGVEFPLTPVTLATLTELIELGKISFSAASQRIFPELIKNPGKPVLEVAQQLDVIQDRDPDYVQSLVGDVLTDFPSKVLEYKKGKKGLLAMFMGEVMKRSLGKADPRLAAELLKKKLNEV